MTARLSENLDANAQNGNIQHLRAIACLFVLCTHLLAIQPALPWVFWSAWSGVDLFFAISGYVISLSFSRTIVVRSGNTEFASKVASNKKAIQAFFIKRFWRIVPPLVATLSLAALLTLTLHVTHWADLLVEIVAALSMTYNYVMYGGGPFLLDVLWSLAVEAQFYLLLPFFLIACSTRRQQLISAVAVFLVIGLIVRPWQIYNYTVATHDWLAVRIATHCRLDTLAAGIFVFFVLGNPRAARLARTLSLRAVRGVFLVCILTLLYIPAITPIEYSHNEGFSVLAIAAAALVFFAAGSHRNIIPTAALRSTLHYIGERSFGIYLLHRLTSAAFFVAFPRVIVAEHTFGGYGNMLRALEGVCVISSTLILAELMYRFVEKPGIRIGKYYAGKIFASDMATGLPVTNDSTSQTRAAAAST